jgi:site-specific recombinase XerD
VIQRVLGHSSLATTDRYLACVAPQDAVDALRAGKWLAA